jgi:hypothetical protein
LLENGNDAAKQFYSWTTASKTVPHNPRVLRNTKQGIKQQRRNMTRMVRELPQTRGAKRFASWLIWLPQKRADLQADMDALKAFMPPLQITPDE